MGVASFTSIARTIVSRCAYKAGWVASSSAPPSSSSLPSLLRYELCFVWGRSDWVVVVMPRTAGDAVRFHISCGACPFLPLRWMTATIHALQLQIGLVLLGGVLALQFVTLSCASSTWARTLAFVALDVVSADFVASPSACAS